MRFVRLLCHAALLAALAPQLASAQNLPLPVCPRPASAAALLDANDVVAVAFPVDEVLVTEGDDVVDGYYKMRLHRVYQGEARAKEHILVSTPGFYDCGFGMRYGGKYLVGLTRRDDGVYVTTVSHGSARFDPYDGDVNAALLVDEIEAELAAREGSAGCGFGSPFGMLQSVALLSLGAAVMRRRTYATASRS